MLDPVALASPHVGPITQVESVNGFAGNQTFRLHTPAGIYYLKLSATAAEEAQACTLAHSVNVPAPHVVALDLNPPYLITAELAGVPLPAGLHPSTVLREAGECVRRVHTLVDASASWGERLRVALGDLGVLPTHLAERLRAVLPAFVESVAGVKPVLLHGDLHPRHLYAVDDQLTGILDWGDVMYGDPLFDLARFSMAGPAATSAFLAGYGAIDVPERTLSFYRVLWSLMALQAEHRAGGDWFQPHLDTIARELS
ncbi:aminoglycoside phosphotransferase family protein [Kribbella sp. NBC_00709]|uniref:phosphotransferase family protein n=1 Tax=Kribbella sp. NBC_00709 TaxID=2975972 RepID=UPI002E2E2349|nr:aminoglycoside phosphotransferase family protein [Kribbella sp. NBC_00709]